MSVTLADVIERLKNYTIKIVVENDNDVYDQINNKLNNYCETIRALDEDTVDKASDLKDKIRQCFDKYCNGNIHDATQIMNEIVKKYENDLYIHDMNYNSNDNINIYKYANMCIYKGVIKDWTEEVDRKYMLHIPFSKRELTKTQRFSMPGVPCLYLGQSIFIIWAELNRPSLDKLFVSRFDLESKTKVLDLGLSIFDLMELNKVLDLKSINDKSLNQILKKFLLTNIFKIACLIRVKQQNRYFKSEYIIPQLLLMGVVNLKLADGIRYSSVKVNNDSYIYDNYAFPAIQESKDDVVSK